MKSQSTSNSNQSRNGNENYRLDDEFRRSRRSLMWISALAVIVSLARSDQEHHFFINFGAMGFGAGMHRGVLSIGLFFAIIYSWAFFERELSRVIASLNSKHATPINGDSGLSEISASENLAIKINELYQQTVVQVNEASKQMITDLRSGPAFWLRSQNFQSQVYNFSSILDSRIGVFQDLLLISDRNFNAEDANEFAAELRDATNRLIKDLEQQLSQIRSEVNQLDLETERSSSLSSFITFIESTEIKFHNYESSLKSSFEKLKITVYELRHLSENIKRSEFLYFNFLERNLPRFLASLATLLVIIWISAWIASAF